MKKAIALDAGKLAIVEYFVYPHPLAEEMKQYRELMDEKEIEAMGNRRCAAKARIHGVDIFIDAPIDVRAIPTKISLTWQEMNHIALGIKNIEDEAILAGSTIREAYEYEID